MANFTLENFEEQIEQKILERGRQYYAEERVLDLKELNAGSWTAAVEGTHTYEVEIQQESNGELVFDCSCPYDSGPICKHVVAVLYAIEGASLPAGATNLPKAPKKRRRGQDQVVDLLQDLPHEELVDLLAEIAEEDRQVAHRILARYGDEGEGKKAYIRLVKNALNLGRSQRGFIDYWGSMRAARGVWTILERAETEIEEGRAAKAVPFFQAVVETVVEAYKHADDSTGMLENCIWSALDGLHEAAEQLPNADRQALFEYCVAAAPTEPYKEWDWGWNLAQIAADLVEDPDQRRRLFDLLDSMAIQRPGQADKLDFLSRYDYERAEGIKLTVVERQDDEKALETFLIERVGNEPFRKRLARFYLEQGHLDEARRLANEWLEQPGQQFPGYRDDFLGVLLNIARLEKDAKEIAGLAQSLFVETGRFEYFDLLKETVSTETWPQLRDRLINLMRRGFRHDSVVPAIMVQEAMWEALLDYAREHNWALDHYRTHLEPRFPAEVGAIYEGVLREILMRQADRGGYRAACEYLRRMRQLGQGGRVDEIVAELRETYKRRPALMDELSKLQKSSGAKSDN